MALTTSTVLGPDFQAPEFTLPGVDGKNHSLTDYREAKALLVVFMCNHCPYVIAVQDRINGLAQEFKAQGLQVIGINSNDVSKYPEDSFEKMKVRAQEKGYVFPYLLDETQNVAKAYDAACTPDPYLFANEGGKFILKYHGRIDDNWKDESAVTRRELAEAIEGVLNAHPVTPPLGDQKPSMGCNIKWKS